MGICLMIHRHEPFIYAACAGRLSTTGQIDGVFVANVVADSAFITIQDWVKLACELVRRQAPYRLSMSSYGETMLVLITASRRWCYAMA